MTAYLSPRICPSRSGQLSPSGDAKSKVVDPPNRATTVLSFRSEAVRSGPRIPRELMKFLPEPAIVGTGRICSSGCHSCGRSMTKLLGEEKGAARQFSSDRERRSRSPSRSRSRRATAMPPLLLASARQPTPQPEGPRYRRSTSSAVYPMIFHAPLPTQSRCVQRGQSRQPRPPEPSSHRTKERAFVRIYRASRVRNARPPVYRTP